jgi:hypothetical protein
LNKRLKNTVDVAEQIVISESDDMISAFFQDSGSNRVLGSSFGVLAAIDFDDKSKVQPDKTDDVTGDGFLSFELDAIEPQVAQPAPHQLRGLGHPASQHACKLMYGKVPSPHTLPNRERAPGPFPVANRCPNDY